ncbi:hypothetical protein DL766_005101 [Monosporascus sp. MC13-8B]|uniref:DZF domain-containing protein n=1 Tax=Monosporascus cannonballus TaxID=155416 RepID=A0ABY0GZK7_9PEZI|nr:hypothetical protein DL762_008873 [Monosporascus cannonballus]RYO97254.1 hypothetical protein DL763_002803 [Monosporascus cannonballus]RYP29955.1 hypothetical protein DL766_005101 [Monosporascus sp. MC13-8B]
MASSSGQPLNSNNPFRRKLGVVHPSSATPGSPAVTTPSGSTSTLTSASTRLDGQGPSSSSLQTATPPPPFTTFSSSLPEDGTRERELHGDKDEPVQPKPRKIVKKVRVQSPPPSSPEDAVPVRSFHPDDAYDDDDDDEDDSSTSTSSTDSRDQEEDVDPFDNAASDTEDHKDIEQPLPRPPANPFSRTLKNLERGGQAQGRGQGQDGGAMPGHAAKGSLDVDSFKRLLLTGHANVSDSAPASGASLAVVSPLQPSPQDGASNTDASSVSRQSMADVIQETPRTSHEISEPEESEGRRNVPRAPPSTTGAPSTFTRKKPPPPNSRHGKLIKIELGADSNAAAATMGPTPSISIGTAAAPSTEHARKTSGQSSSIARSQSPASSITDINKPLPPPPSRAPADEAESPFDREAAGKIPEEALLASPQQAAAAQQPQSPPSSRGRSESQSSTQSRTKPAAPAPPPRRHTRTESKPPLVQTGSAEEDKDQARSSLDSNRSRADSLRVSNGGGGGPAPAPPPRRRPNHARSGSSFTPMTQVQHGPVASFPASRSPSLDEQRPVSVAGIPATPAQPERPSNLAAITTTPREGLPKVSPPPLPPARHASTRRPPSVRVASAEAGAPAPGVATTRKVSREKDGVPMAPPPPPPPPRQRGSSRGGAEAPTGGGGGDARKAGRDGEGKGTSTPPQTQTQSPSSSADILADLDALQKEVDALMTQYPKGET